ncbi:MAG TPA: sugar phosphate isomerase/epimerase family protein [Chloroflexota bacterium]|nr:sugar phosphate isomerase/epimerase family protein [Chloroflexota bacterium]
MPERVNDGGAVRLGINLMAWSGAVGLAELDLLPRIAELGYDGVELPIFQPEAVDVTAVRRALEASGLAATVSTALPRGASLLDPAERAAGVAFLDRCAAAAAACGATMLCGPMYTPVGQLPGRSRTTAEWDSCVAGLQTAGERAARYGVNLAVELLNRFETHFLNTVDDGVALVEAVDQLNVALHLDTFHMNIEERSIPDAFRRAGRYLRHVHAAENDRGSVGSGHVDWPGIAVALRQLNYHGWIVAETFTAQIPEIAAATAIWRPLVPDGWTYARESLDAMKRAFG